MTRKEEAFLEQLYAYAHDQGADSGVVLQAMRELNYSLGRPPDVEEVLCYIDAHGNPERAEAIRKHKAEFKTRYEIQRPPKKGFLRDLFPIFDK